MPKTSPFADIWFLSLPVRSRDTVVRVAGETLAPLDAGPERGGLHVPIPGWAWKEVKPRDDLKLSIGSGWIRKKVALTRDDLANRLKQLSAIPYVDVPIFDLITALEHAHYAKGLFASLPQDVQKYLQKAASETGLQGALPGRIIALAILAKSPSDDPLTRSIIADFGAARRIETDVDDITLLQKALGSAKLNNGQSRTIALELTSHFCRCDDPENLYKILLQDDLSLIAPEDDMAWQGSHCLPGRILAGDAEGASAILEDLIRNPARWAATPAIAWSMRSLAFEGEDRFDDQNRIALLTLTLGYLDAQEALYFGVLPCTELRRTTADLILHCSNFDVSFRKDLIATALRCYGHSPGFWRTLNKTEAKLPHDVMAAAASFEALQKAMEHPRSDEQIQSALDELSDLGVRGLRGIALDLLGPSGLPDDPAGLSATVGKSDTFDPVRSLSAPLPRTPENLSAHRVSNAMQRAYQHTPTAPFAEIAGRAGRLSHRLIQSVIESSDSAQSEMQDALLPLLSELCTPEAEHRGIGLGLSVLADLAAQDNKRAAREFGNRLGHMLRRVLDRDGKEVLAAPWPYAAGRRLGASPNEFFDLLCEVVPELEVLRPSQPMATTQTTLPNPDALHDTLVVIETSSAGINDQDFLRGQDWIGEFAKRKIPVVFAIESPDPNVQWPTLDGNVLSVPFGNNSEDAPARSVSIIDWVQSHTDFAHLTLLDDETEIAVPAWADQLNYRLVDFYGQISTIWEKDRNRREHQPFASRTRARLGFEKLPRDLTIADGRFGLTLSRRAMQAVMAVLATPDGQILKRSAFDADRLISAALQKKGIWPSGAGLYASHFAADRAGGPIVSKTPNGFELPLPGSDDGNITQVAHGKAAPRPEGTVLWPRKIWANHVPARLGLYSNALHLISSEDRLADPPEISVISVLRNERFILPHFLKHYRNLGVSRFLIADNGSDDGSVEYLLDQSDVILFSAENQFRHANQGTDWKIALMQHYCQDGWALVADADEFLVFPGYERDSLSTYLSRYDGSTIDAVRCLMLDMYPQGKLSEASFEAPSPFDEAGFADRKAFLYNSLGRGPYSNIPTVTSGLRHRMMPGSRTELFVTQKVPLFRYKPWMRFSVSLHYAAEVNLAPDDLMFAHFKYHADFRQKAEREVARGQYFNNAEEYRKYLSLTAEGQDRLYDPALSVPWRDVPEVRRILQQKA